MRLPIGVERVLANGQQAIGGGFDLGLAATALPLAAVCLLRRMENQTPTVPAVIGRLTPQRAFSAVLTHAHEFNPHDLERRKRMLHAYLELVDTVPVYDVQFAVGGEWLEGVLDTFIGTFSLGRTA